MTGLATLVACSKSDTPQPEETFDINNPEGYFLYVKTSLDNGSFRRIILFEFMPGNVVKQHTPSRDYTNAYTIIDNNTIDIAGETRFTFNDNLVTSNRGDIKEIVLIKAPERNQLAGKTFAGTYYTYVKAVLHPNFFYSFSATGNTFGAGFNTGTTLRSESYTPIGNFASRTRMVNGDRDFMVLVNGKLEVNYVAQNAIGAHYGTFEEQ
ncbi:hypothetical protein GCM10027051_30330 [Niabella terrae]